jgi:predicted RNA-binding Zn-ribbon protein involved in translation (DUF1610 family)
MHKMIMSEWSWGFFGGLIIGLLIGLVIALIITFIFQLELARHERVTEMIIQDWDVEADLTCPGCGKQAIWSKINPDNEYSQFFCIDCCWSDNKIPGE